MRRSNNGPEPSARGNFTPPARGTAPSVPHSPAVAVPPAGSRFSPRNWRVPAKLNAILLIPVVVGLVMGGFQVKSSIETWNEAEDAENTAVLVRAALTYGDALINERDVSAAPLLKGDRDDPTVKRARGVTDQAAADFEEAVRNMPDKPGLERRLAAFRDSEHRLGKLRESAYSAKLKGVKTEEGYTAIQHPLMEFANELGLGTGNITSYGRTVYAVSLSKAAASLQRSIGMHLLVKPGPDAEGFGMQRTALGSYAYLEVIATEEYKSGGRPEDVERYTKAEAKVKTDLETKAKQEAARAKAKGKRYQAPPTTPKMVGLLTAMPEPTEKARQDLARKGVTQQAWWAVNTARFDAYREIESSLSDQAVNEAASISDDARRSTFVTAAVVLLALLIAFVLAGLMARQMSLSMRRLRTAAFGVAEQRLPMMVDQLSRTDPGRVDTRVDPIPISSTDEIGEVARAFDQVHREAVRLAAEQALLRGNINAIFTNLSRRNQSLIEGQLTLITDLENNEADPDQLENLFRLDHLATRMRRNGENLLVLAGEEPGRRWDQPVPLVDVLRAASSEVEQYERIELAGVPEADIHGRAVTDLVHLLAELLENATTFSSPQTKVRVAATRLPDGRVMIEIHDKGIGLTAEDFADINHKLANPPTVDAAISQRMGLFVVGRLADRHGIRVQLRPSGEQAGTTSLVMLPEVITHGGGGELTADPEFTVSSIIPQQQAHEVEPSRTAAELGFDDSQYHQIPDDLRDLDPVGRSLMREERRAALSPPTHGDDDRFYAGTPQDEYDGYSGPDGPNGYDGPDGSTDSYEDPSYPATQHQQPYEQPQQPGYEQPLGYDPAGYDERQPYQEHTQDYGLVQQSYEQRPQPAYEERYQGGQDGYPDLAYAPADGAGRTDAPQETFQAFADYRQEPAQGAWPPRNGHRAAHPDEQEDRTDSGLGPAAPDDERVGFDLQGSTSTAPSDGHELTGAGLPRRGSKAGGNPGVSGASRQWPQADNGSQEAPPHHDSESAADDDEGDRDEDWRSANDERWQRAESLKKPKAGGVTPSGLPRRVPQANLIEGTAEQTPQGGPQVSRSPEDVRGRLSNLRRGVQRGRAGSDTNGQAAPNQSGGPDSTYNQER
ncbi:sensor histidine kinase [Streptomyces sp. NA04227]|uniref:sensor histidine kinase n=1 Tax=Streptomyces sp. NA04227 TaxID=2742136 RepID=UPI0015916BAB|nr:nitrate- and nitrite sensing domain-containing protein [Streptomyces sp. NA04227]QKW09401.1 sensor histidine kinase [Streptomyces sp. NA04227]